MILERPWLCPCLLSPGLQTSANDTTSKSKGKRKVNNQSAAQAAVADPSRRNSTSAVGKNPSIQQNCRKFLTNTSISMGFRIYEKM